MRAYGCNGLLGLRVSRVTYLIGTDGRIQEVAKAALRVGPASRPGREDPQSLKSGCPEDGVTCPVTLLP